jgi:hypothetical protein
LFLHYTLLRMLSVGLTQRFLIMQAVLKMLNEIGSVENIPDFLEGVKNRSVSRTKLRHTIKDCSFP